jgi:acetylornithine deacetylase/succinyl-diaminopimelate desuccinylase-like protein
MLTVRASVTALLLLLFLTPALLRGAGNDSDLAVEWLQDYLRIDSSIPTGAAEAASFLRDVLHRHGIATRWLVSPEGRPSLYAQLDPRAEASETVVLLHHTDVVPPGSGWTKDPFGAEVEDGILFGRGAVDDKSLGIAHLWTFIEMSKKPERMTRGLAFLAVTDEETGGLQGSGWLVEKHPEIFRNVVAVLGEGGMNRVRGDQVAWWGIEVAQKRPLWLRATARGRPGHGSTLNLHTAPHRLIHGLSRLLDRPLDFRITPEARRYLEAVAPMEPQGFQKVVVNLDEIFGEPDPATRLMPGMPNYFLDSIQINGLEAGQRLNAAPEKASALIDIRLLPDADEEAFLREIRELVGTDVELEVLLSAPRSPASPTDTPFFLCLEEILGQRAPVAPAFIPGITDARYFRQRDIPAYGFSPFMLDGSSLRGIHGPDERIPIEAFQAGVSELERVITGCVTE